MEKTYAMANVAELLLKVISKCQKCVCATMHVSLMEINKM